MDIATGDTLVVTDISKIFDGAYYGFIVSVFLLGISVVQAWTYFNHNSDSWILRVMVFMVLSLNMAKAWADNGIIHNHLVVNFGNVELPAIAPLTLWIVDFIISGIVLLIVHIYFASRIYLLGGGFVIPVIVCLFSIGMLLLGPLLAVSTKPVNDALLIPARLEVTIFHVFAAITDIIVTLGLCYILHKSKKRSNIIKTRKIVERLLIFLGTRGLITTFVEIAHLTMFSLRPNDASFWSSLHFTLSHIYAITVLVVLNARPSANSDRHSEDFVVQNSGIDFAHTTATQEP